MHRVAAILLLAAASAHAATKPSNAATSGVCTTFSEATVRTLTGVPTGAFTARASHRPPFTERCVYGVTLGDLVLDISHFPTDAQALAHMAALGTITNSVNNTDSPYGTDQINQWTRILADSNNVPAYDVSGFAARHGTTVVAIGLDRPESDFSKDGVKRLQAAALTTAGARLAPWAKIDVCARVPARAIQSLVTLGPATVLTTVQKSSNGNSSCEYEVHPFDSDDSSMRVLLSPSPNGSTTSKPSTANTPSPPPPPHSRPPTPPTSSSRSTTAKIPPLPCTPATAPRSPSRTRNPPPATIPPTRSTSSRPLSSPPALRFSTAPPSAPSPLPSTPPF